jgi:hypothetical protein
VTRAAGPMTFVVIPTRRSSLFSVGRYVAQHVIFKSNASIFGRYVCEKQLQRLFESMRDDPIEIVFPFAT